MTLVTAQMSISVDGFYAGSRHDDMNTWLDGTEAAGFFRVTRWAIDAEAWRQRLGFKGGEQNTNSEVITETFDSAGAAAASWRGEQGAATRRMKRERRIRTKAIIYRKAGLSTRKYVLSSAR